MLLLERYHENCQAVLCATGMYGLKHFLNLCFLLHIHVDFKKYHRLNVDFEGEL